MKFKQIRNMNRSLHVLLEFRSILNDSFHLQFFDSLVLPDRKDKMK